jgi:2,5-diamino-6-(ribosylamino)-4(3H)-pyrimidinone 5'-phosphate reductase
MIPYVVIHTAVSVDCRMDRLDVDMEQYYSLIPTWKEDCTLSSSQTMLQAGLEEWEHDGSSDPSAPLLAVVDGRGRFNGWKKVAPSPFWRKGVALSTTRTPEEHLEQVRSSGADVIVAGDEHVDLRAALEELNVRYGVGTVRVDSGGTLNGVLLRAGLVSEVSMVMQPQLIGGRSPSSFFIADDLGGGAAMDAELMSVERLDGGSVWLRYRLKRDQ